jgi:predicted transcriptional regulator
MTVMNIMTRKGYLSRRMKGRAYFYRARSSEGRTLGKIFQDLVRRGFGGSPRAALIHLLETCDLKAEELDELRKLIDRKEREGIP